MIRHVPNVEVGGASMVPMRHFLPRRVIHACMWAIDPFNWGLAYVLAKKPFRFLLNLGIMFMTMLLLFAAFVCGTTDVTLAVPQPLLSKAPTASASADQVIPP